MCSQLRTSGGMRSTTSLTCRPPPPAAPAPPHRPPQLPPPRPPRGRRRRRTCRTWPHTGAPRRGGEAAAAASPARGEERREAEPGGGGGDGQRGPAGARGAALWSPLLRRAVQGRRGREQRFSSSSDNGLFVLVTGFHPRAPSDGNSTLQIDCHTI
jgi:hypothetical protein